MLNPRKVFTHCKLVARVTTYQRAALRVCPDVETAPELCVEKRRERQRATLLTHVAEKDFTFSEEMNLSPGREGAAEILSSKVRGCVTETKLVGSKLLFKGVFRICLLYRTAPGAVLLLFRGTAVLSDHGGGGRAGGLLRHGPPAAHRR